MNDIYIQYIKPTIQRQLLQSIKYDINQQSPKKFCKLSKKTLSMSISTYTMPCIRVTMLSTRLLLIMEISMQYFIWLLSGLCLPFMHIRLITYGHDKQLVET